MGKNAFLVNEGPNGEWYWVWMPERKPGVMATSPNYKSRHKCLIALERFRANVRTASVGVARAQNERSYKIYGKG